MDGFGHPFLNKAFAVIKYREAINNLPPTYSANEFGFPQFIPDYNSPQVVASRLADVNAAERELKWQGFTSMPQGDYYHTGEKMKLYGRENA